MRRIIVVPLRAFRITALDACIAPVFARYAHAFANKENDQLERKE